MAVITKFLFHLEADILFDIMLHYGSLIVLLIIFHKQISKIIFSLLPKSFFQKKYKTFKQYKYYKQYRKLAYYIIIASIPTALAGYFLHDIFVKLFSDIFIVSIALLITGVILFSTKFKSQYPTQRKNTELNKNNTLKSLTIGISQALAIIPGISRSGSTISTGILLGLSKRESARFSFLLAIPAIFGATLYEIHTTPETVFHISYIVPILVGTIVSIIVGYISLKWLLKIIRKGKFHRFAYYCWAVGIIILIF